MKNSGIKRDEKNRKIKFEKIMLQVGFELTASEIPSHQHIN